MTGIAVDVGPVGRFSDCRRLLRSRDVHVARSGELADGLGEVANGFPTSRLPLRLAVANLLAGQNIPMGAFYESFRSRVQCPGKKGRRWTKADS